MARAATTASNTTFWITRECPRTDCPEVPCEVARIDNYGVPTDVLLCLPHGEVVGHVT